MHNHVKKLERMHEEGKLPKGTGLHQLQVKHDNWCALLAGKGECNCDPDIDVLPAQHPSEDQNK